ncbi:hypothetical protein PHISCL_03816 [Aspergillus sclerotialis]|uniref:Uncharacterized protein n=1 Tax=Aspergillus sclerotialis TaxID=2070753 RepID=A0A3A2ZX10_9EURO|nr:hypothetical protein PHISCL_03816 [Aspergillus sclerotialis]
MSSLPPATQPRKYRSRTQKPWVKRSESGRGLAILANDLLAAISVARGEYAASGNLEITAVLFAKQGVLIVPMCLLLLSGTERSKSVYKGQMQGILPNLFQGRNHHAVGDHDPYLLQPTSDEKRQGDTAWACQRVSDDPDMPAQFTIVPDQHLDAQPSYYPKNNVEEAARPHKEALIKAYFDTVHSSFPILDPTAFDVDSSPTPLLAAMYALSHKFCPEAGGVDPWIFLNFLGRALPLEARNPKLDSIEASLLYSQRHTYIFR